MLLQQDLLGLATDPGLVVVLGVLLEQAALVLLVEVLLERGAVVLSEVRREGTFFAGWPSARFRRRGSM